MTTEQSQSDTNPADLALEPLTDLYPLEEQAILTLLRDAGFSPGMAALKASQILSDPDLPVLEGDRWVETLYEILSETPVAR